MRITIISPPPNMSGGIRVVAVYAEFLRRRGHDVLIVHPPRRKVSLRGRIRSVLHGEGLIGYSKRPPSHFEGIETKIHVLNRARPVVDADVPDADVVIATWWETAEWVASLAPNKGTKAYFMQDYGAPGQPIDKVAATWQIPMRIIVVSQYLKNLVNQHCDAEVEVIPNAVDIDTFGVPPRNKPKRPTVGFVYMTATEKGTNVCIEAIRIAREKIPEIEVVSFGSTPPLPTLKLPPETKFGLRIPDSELKSYYGSCTAWLYGSHREGFGLPILEAMAAQTPVIATPAAAAPELVNEERGILVRHNRPEEMARAIVRICELPDQEWKNLSNAALAKASAYSWDDATEMLEKFLLSLVERSTPDESK